MTFRDRLVQIPHFKLHPEVLPYIGSGDILIIDECGSLPNNNLKDKLNIFKNWYTEPTPKHIDGVTDNEWEEAKNFYNVQSTGKHGSIFSTTFYEEIALIWR